MENAVHPGESSHQAFEPPGEQEGQSREVSRRTLMSALAKMGVTAAVAGPMVAVLLGSQHDAQAAETPKASVSMPVDPAVKHQWAMVLDLRLCDGCKQCTLACQTRHQLPKEQAWIKVYEMKNIGGGTYHMPRPCMMCEDAPCVYVCPVGANIRTDEGLVLVDQNVCIGSRICMSACPYEARYFNWKQPPKTKPTGMPASPEMPVPQQKGTVGKCVWCADRLPHGELPACVIGCPMGTIYIGDLVSDVAVNSHGHVVKLSQFLRENDAVRYKEELGTNPRVRYILGHKQDWIGP